MDDEGELIFAPGGTAPIYADDTYETELFRIAIVGMATPETCLLYTSDAADD